MTMNFDHVRAKLAKQFEHPEWIEDSGLPLEQVEQLVQALEGQGMSRAMTKASALALIAQKARIAVDREDCFQDKVDGAGILRRQRVRWEKQVKAACLPEESREMEITWNELGACLGNGDYGHISPNTRLMLEIGLPGLLERVEQAARREGLSPEQVDFYTSCVTALQAMMTLARRLADGVEPYRPENSRVLRALTMRAPDSLYEAMQLLVLYFFFHEFIGGARVRTLGRLDVLLTPFYRRDLERGTCTAEQAKELLKFFLHKFWSAKVPFDLPFCLCGADGNGGDVTNELSWLIVETYDELNIYSPKIHIRVSDHTPGAFVRRVLDCIRRGNSSFVFVSDRVAMESLRRVGIEEQDLADYVPIGCYEPAVWGVEMGCTGNGGVSLPKALELVFNNGRDLATGIRCGLETGEIGSYEAFVSALKAQIEWMTRRSMDYVVAIEGYYDRINPDPLLSCQYDHSVELGVDLYSGGAKYNNSSMYFYSIASLTDAVCAVKKLVFEEKQLTFAQLGAILKDNWQGHEPLRRQVLALEEKYGNNHPAADAVAVEFADFCASLVNNRPNGRGGVFKAALFSIDHCFKTGQKTMATPDGRRAGEPLSKNLCAVAGLDRNGITALIHSVTKFDLADFPNGSVLDVVLHPSAVVGEEGLDAFYALLMTYFRMGGFAMHGNVFSSEDLKRARKEPERYKNLQVRVCGWNAYFVNLSQSEQEAFIRQAENNER